MKPSVRCAASLAALGALASCGAPVPPAGPQASAPASAQPASPVPPAAATSSESAPKPAAAPKPAPLPQAANQVHSATVTYRAPSGLEEVGFTVTVAPDGTIVAAASQTKGASPKTVRYQDAFSAGIAGAVVGQKISSLNVGAVAGASLTTAAFVKYVRSF